MVPFSYFFCLKADCGCSCKSLDYPFRSGPKCEFCAHSATQHMCYFNTKISNQIVRQVSTRVPIPVATLWALTHPPRLTQSRYGNEGKGAAAMRFLKKEVLGRVLLRRTKVGRADDITLPPRTVVLRKERLDPREQDFYEALYTQAGGASGSLGQIGAVPCICGVNMAP